MNRKSSNIGVIEWMYIVMTVFCIIVIGVYFYRPFNKISDMRNVTVTITDKAVKNENSNSKYLVFTEDERGNIYTFEITDSLLKGRFNSSDVYAAIKVGSRYKLTIGGSRNKLLSWYPNIYKYELIESKE